MRTVWPTWTPDGRWRRALLALPALLAVVALLAGCGGGAGRQGATPAPAPPMAAPPAAPPSAAGGWPLAPRATPTPDVTPAFDAVRATSTAVMAALAPRDAAMTTLVGDWQVAVVHAWVADLPPEYGAPVGRRSVLIDLAAVNTHADRSLRWEWLRQAQTLTLLSSDRRYIDLAPDGGVGGHPLLRAAAAAACPEGGMTAVGEVETLAGDAAARGVTVPPRMPVRALALFTLPADDAPPDAWMLQIRLPDGSARVRLALALTPAPGASVPASARTPTPGASVPALTRTPTPGASVPALTRTPTPGASVPALTRTPTPGASAPTPASSAWMAADAPPLAARALDRAAVRSAVWRDWELTRVAALPGGRAAWAAGMHCGTTVAITADVVNRQAKSRPWPRTAWIVDASGRYVEATAPSITLDPGIPERITLTAPWSPLLDAPAAVIIADGADATALSIVPPDAMESPAYPPTPMPTAAPTGTPATPTPAFGAD